MDAVNQLRQQLMAVATPADAVPMAAYMKQIAPFLGVKADARRRVVSVVCRAPYRRRRGCRRIGPTTMCRARARVSVCGC